MQDKTFNQYNNHNKRHGYWEVYNSDIIYYKTYYINGIVFGREEWGTGEKRYNAR